MKLSDILNFKSERGIRTALSSLIFGEKNRLMAAAVQHQRMTETVSALRNAGHNDRASDIENGKAYTQAEGRALEAAGRLRALDVEATSRGLNIDVEVEPTMRRIMDAKQAKLAAECSGVDEAVIIKAATDSAKQQFEREQHAKLTAQSLFYTAEEPEDIDVNAETVLNALLRERARVLTFSNIVPYLGELTLLKRDIDSVEHILHVAATHEGENDGTVDNAHIEPVVIAVPTKKFRRVKKEDLATELS